MRKNGFLIKKKKKKIQIIKTWIKFFVSES